MQLNSLPQIYEMVVVEYLEEGSTLDLDLLSFYGYKIASTTINNIFNTISYTLYFSDMISQTKFIEQLINKPFSYTLKGLLYLDNPHPNLESFING